MDLASFCERNSTQSDTESTLDDRNTRDSQLILQPSPSPIAPRWPQEQLFWFALALTRASKKKLTFFFRVWPDFKSHSCFVKKVDVFSLKKSTTSRQKYNGVGTKVWNNNGFDDSPAPPSESISAVFSSSKSMSFRKRVRRFLTLMGVRGNDFSLVESLFESIWKCRRLFKPFCRDR